MSRTKEFLEKAFNDAEREEVLESSNYYFDGTSKYKFDPATVFEFGETPDLNAGDLTRCTLELADYINKKLKSFPELADDEDFRKSFERISKNLPIDKATLLSISIGTDNLLKITGV